MPSVDTTELANLDNPASATAAINLNISNLDAGVAASVAKAGDTMTGPLNMNGQRITNLPEAVADTEPVRLGDIADIVEAASDELSVKYKARGYRTAAVNSPNNAWGAVALDTEDYDTGGIFDTATGRFTPTVAGYYLVNIRARTGTTGSIAVAIGKNGSEALGVGGDIASSLGSGGSGLIHCNGTSDYLQLFVFTNTARAITTGSFDTWMSIVGPF
jgi:hypothetical protein